MHTCIHAYMQVADAEDSAAATSALLLRRVLHERDRRLSVEKELRTTTTPLALEEQVGRGRDWGRGRGRVRVRVRVSVWVRLALKELVGLGVGANRRHVHEGTCMHMCSRAGKSHA